MGKTERRKNCERVFTHVFYNMFSSPFKSWLYNAKQYIQYIGPQIFVPSILAILNLFLSTEWQINRTFSCLKADDISNY